ncbi:MAG: hypothetical protein QM723_19105 [Myxococcaceae bacterium]
MDLIHLNLRALCVAANAQISVTSPIGELHLEPRRERLVQATQAKATTADLVLLNATRVTMKAGPKGDVGDFFPRDFVQLATVLERVLDDASPRPAFACCVDVLISTFHLELRLTRHAGHRLLPGDEPFITLNGAKARWVRCDTCNGILVGWSR